MKLCAWLQALPASVALRESVWAYPVIETMHVLGLCVFLGLVALLDLRLLGKALSRTPVSLVQQRLFPWTMMGFAIMVTTGSLLFFAEPLRFYTNVFFIAKGGLLVLAGLNAFAFHSTIYRSVGDWGGRTLTPFRARLAGAFSLVLWAAIVVTGRFIAYNWFN